MAEGFAKADVIVEDEYRVPAQEHAYLQPEAGLAYLDENGLLTVKSAGQWTHADQKQIAHALDLPTRKGPRAVSEHRRRVWRTGRPVGADRAGAGSLEA